ncbi:hypothetical protein FDP41_006553 [Naegleria fowleri]|uniref:Non-canonical E2 ubiquitin-conjugating enzyme C-terminal domain-containing protein n=1 Tax=Naegleria fowleri TaxID=5763 RepID=A0A6A5BJD7_NAEFO|nr:uncharacterized protein FDP41_006553 [Naegleria fowleri]KAF0974521.1 hypothetical protein FDP41_006553 [Naegleria fowleri]
MSSSHQIFDSLTSGKSVAERARFIPLRLNLEERKKLRLLEAALNVSEYTDKIDTIRTMGKLKRIKEQCEEICAILCGLMVAADYKLGQELIANKNFKDNEEFFQEIFEIGRRYKIMNPEKMRSTYGKLCYIIQDSQIPEVQEMLGFKLDHPVKTVYWFLEQKGVAELLEDPDINIATNEIFADGKSRSLVEHEIKLKEQAVKRICKKYSEMNDIEPEEIEMCLYSISDSSSYLRQAVYPVDTILQFFLNNFSRDHYEEGKSLAIQAGREGARLSHNHAIQFDFVYQTLMLWKNVGRDMFELWFLAERDLFSSDYPYSLTNTGQGLNRVQYSPLVRRAMERILLQTQRSTSSWVGSSVIHLGDDAVPNALMFIDKYTQVPRILNPIIQTLKEIDNYLVKDDNLKKYIDETFGGPEEAKLMILLDFFRHGFDGSGADNFFMAGSCIDGRLTSAWNWTSKINKKPYYPLFLLGGFIGFDGEFRG